MDLWMLDLIEKTLLNKILFLTAECQSKQGDILEIGEEIKKIQEALVDVQRLQVQESLEKMRALPIQIYVEDQKGEHNEIN